MGGKNVTRQLKVLLFISSLEIGGAERSLVSLANEFNASGLEVVVVVLDSTGPLCRELDRDIDLVDLETQRGRKSVFAFAKAIKRIEPDIVVSFLTVSNMVSGLAGRLLGRNRPVLIGTEHSYFTDITDRAARPRFSFFVYRALARYGYRGLDRLVAVSLGVKDRVVVDHLVRAEKVTVIPTPFTPPRQASEPPPLSDRVSVNEVRLLAVGRLDPLKDYPTLLQAVHEMVSSGHKIRLDILGDGPERETLEHLAHTLGISGSVNFHGAVLRPADWYPDCDVFVLTSIREGFGLVLVEALFHGCRIVSTDCPSGPRDILDDGKFGRLVPVGDVLSLKEALLEVMKERPDRQALRRRALEFSQARIIPKYLELFFEARVMKSAVMVQTRGRRIHR